MKPNPEMGSAFFRAPVGSDVDDTWPYQTEHPVLSNSNAGVQSWKKDRSTTPEYNVSHKSLTLQNDAPMLVCRHCGQAENRTAGKELPFRSSQYTTAYGVDFRLRRRSR